MSRNLLARLAGRLDRPRQRARGRRQARPLALTNDLLLLQTSDPHVYFDMLCLSARTAREYCRRHDIAYHAFVGVKRGFHAWQATYNRIPLLHDLAEDGFAGWVLYLDADAYVADLTFDLRAYLADKAAYAAILTPITPGAAWWDVNAGVALFNLGSEHGRRLVARWHAAFLAIGDDALRADGRWALVRNDQDLLHDVLRADTALRAQVFLQSTDLLNSDTARFVRQVLRAQAEGMAARMAILRRETDRILAQASLADAATAATPKETQC